MRKSINGFVIEKYKDESNHGAPTIIYKNEYGKNKFQVIDWSRKSDFWDYIQAGDSIIKPSSELTMRVKKNNGDYKDYKYRP